MIQSKFSEPDSLELFGVRLQKEDLTLPKQLGLTTKEEQIWTEYYAETYFSNRGQVVELGPWLGSLTKAIQRGLLKNALYLQNPTPILAYDRFVWEQWCEDHVKNTPHESRIPLGSSFEEMFSELVRIELVPVQSVKVDLLDDFPVPEKIEFLINDAIKTWQVALSVSARFFPRLLPGACVAHQDFLWPTEAFLVPLMYFYRKFFELKYIVPGSCMGVFVFEGNLDHSKLEKMPPNIESFEEDLISAAFNWISKCSSAMDSQVVALCRATCLWQATHRISAKKVIQDSALATATGSPLFEFQRQILTGWGYSEMFQA